MRQMGAVALIVAASLFVMGQNSPTKNVAANEFVQKDSKGPLRVFPATRKGDFSRKLAMKIRENKACLGIMVTANKEQAEYTAMHGLTTSGWIVYRRNGDVVQTGSTMLVKTLAREVCEAVREDHSKKAKDRDAP
jgi:hypothetical protein